MLAGLAGAPPPATAAEARSESTLQSVQRKIRELKDRLTSRKSKAKNLESRLESAESERARLGAQLRDRERSYEERNQRLLALESRREALRGELDYHRAALVRQVRTAFIIGHQEKLKLLLNQSNPALVGRTLAYYDYFNQNRAQQIVAAQQNLEGMRAVEGDIRSELAAMQKTLQALRQEKAAMDEARSERGRVLAALHEEIGIGENELKRLESDQRRLQGVVDELTEDSPEAEPEPPPRPAVEPRRPAGMVPPPVATAPGRTQSDRPFGQLKGRLPWPTTGTLKARFGSARAGSSSLRWQGVYITSAMGGEVRAVSSGRVAFADWIRGFGLMVIVDHGSGFMSLYGHNQSVFRKPGERVQAGDVIAAVGDSGGQDSAGLYFEIRSGGKPVDPEKWCARDSRLVRVP